MRIMRGLIIAEGVELGGDNMCFWTYEEYLKYQNELYSRFGGNILFGNILTEEDFKKPVDGTVQPEVVGADLVGSGKDDLPF